MSIAVSLVLYVFILNPAADIHRPGAGVPESLQTNPNLHRQRGGHVSGRGKYHLIYTHSL